MFLSTITSFAQDISELKIVGAPELDPSELISSERRDSNGEVAAGIIFLTDLTNLSFEPRNGPVGGTKADDGQYFLFVSPNERIITVRAAGFKPLTLYLSDIGVRLKSGQVWKITITGSKVGDLVPINILVDQQDAKVLIDGEEKDHKKSISTSLGTHTLRIEKEQYKTIVETIEVTNEKTLFQFQMKKVDLQLITIRSNPSDATVLIDDQVVGQTTFQDFKFPGIYQIKVTKPGYKAINQTVEVTENEAFERSYNLQKTVASLNLALNPQSATIKINNKDYTGFTSIELAAGTYVLEVSKNGYETYNETFTLAELQQVSRSITLKQYVGTLLFRINEPDAQVTLSGNGFNRSWRGTSKQDNIPAGRYTITASMQGYTNIQQSVMIEGNETNSVSMAFSDQDKQAYVDQQKKIAEQIEAKRIADAQAKRRAELAAKKKRDEMFKPQAFSMMGFGYGTPTLTAKEMTVVGEAYSFGWYIVERDGSNYSMWMDYFTSTEEAVYGGELYNSFEGLTMNFGMGYGLNIGSLYLHGNGLAQLLMIDLDGDDADYISVIDIGLGYKVGALLNFDGFAIGIDYSQQLVNTLDTISYDKLSFTVGFGF